MKKFIQNYATKASKSTAKSTTIRKPVIKKTSLINSIENKTEPLMDQKFIIERLLQDIKPKSLLEQ